MRSVGVYGKSDDRSKALRASYREHLVRVFTLLGGSPADAGADADRVLGLETSLTSRALSPVQERDTEGHDHLLDAAALRARFPVVDLPSLVAKMGAVLDRANVSAMAWVGAVDATLAGADLAGVRAYLRAYVARDFAESLPSAFARERFDWERHTLRGIQKMDTRADRCLALLDGNVGEDVGRIFVERYYDTATRHLMDGMIARVQGALRNEIRSSDWLSPAAKAAADEKLRRVLVVTGASNRLRNLDGVAIEPGDLFGDVWRSRAAATAYELARLSRPTDREEFFDSLPQEFDGFGSKRTNTMGFTAGILQPPVLDPRVDDAVNYGGLGSVIGHELSHLLDDEGRKYDASGNVRPWWSPEDVANFEKRAKCFQDEYDQFHGDEGTKLDGKLTLGENLGDNDGIRASYDALHPSETGPRVDGYTPAQRFFLAWGQIRCQSLTPEREHDLIVDNPHAPGHWRVDGVVVNMPEFASAFACAAGTPMAPASRCRLW
jgi:predicted metalloendopeptidase